MVGRRGVGLVGRWGQSQQILILSALLPLMVPGWTQAAGNQLTTLAQAEGIQARGGGTLPP